jgi:FkbM family methyltransferase
MKLKQIPYMLGLKPRVQTYGIDVATFQLPQYGAVDFARWLHPREKDRVLAQSQVDPLHAFLRPGDVAIDIGGHVGDTAVPMALAVGPDGIVLALEPNRHIFPVLQRNSELNPQLTHIEPLMWAATPEDGEMEFEYSDPAFHNGGNLGGSGIGRWRHAHAFTLKVEGRNLETWLRRERPELIPRLRYIKVDAEGFDLSILRSLEGLLRETRPYIRAEVYRHLPRERREEMVGYLEGLGYAVHHFGGDEGYQGRRIGPEDVMLWRHFDIFAVPSVEAGAVGQ